MGFPLPIELIMDNILSKLYEIATLAGDKIIQIYSASDLGVELKEDDSPLTLADRAAHGLILEQLKAWNSEIPVISEESNPDEMVLKETDSRFWLVDPLDGTKEFIKKTGEFTVNIALMDRKTGPVAGIVHAPAIGVTYLAEKGQGAWKWTQEGKVVEKISIQTRKPDLKNLCVVASKDHAGPLVEAMLQRLPGAQLTSMGSSLKFCLVAEGKADLYPRFVPTMEWDTAAAQCVVETAGGSLVTVDQRPLTYGKDNWKNPSVLAYGDPDQSWEQYLPDLA